MPVLFVCLSFSWSYFLIFKEKFVSVNNLTTHTANNYRMNDVTMILIYLFKNFVSTVMNLSISSPRKPLITHNWKYFLGRNINSKLF